MTDRVRTAALQARLWYWQRVSAMVLALCVVVHLATIVFAVRGGLSAGEILARTKVRHEAYDDLIDSRTALAES